MKRLALVAVVLALTVLAARFGPGVYRDAAASSPSGDADRLVQACSHGDGDELAAIRRLFDEASDLNNQGRFDEADDRYLEAARASGELLYARASCERGRNLIARTKPGHPDERGLLLKAEQQFRDCLARETRSAKAPLLYDGARRHLEGVRQRLTQTVVSAPATKSKSGEAKTVGDSSAVPAVAKVSRPSESVPFVKPRQLEASRPPVVVETPTPRRSEPAPLMVGPDGVIYQPLRAEPESRR